MLRHGITLGSTQLLARLPQLSLLTSLPGSSSSSSSSSSSIWPRAAAQGISSSAAVANEAEEVLEAPDARQAARELGLDAVPLSKLKEMMAEAIPQDGPGLLEVPRQPARQKRLTYADVQGYEQLLSSLVMLPGSHAQNMPKAPMLDAGQWVDTHFKQEGYGFEPRSPFYAWRAWAAAALPLEQAQTLVAMEAVMADDSCRAVLLKQAQHELARLWDWQHRRVALGLPPDLPHTSSSSSSAMPDAAAAAAAAAEAAAARAAAAAEAEAAAAAAAAELQEADLSGSSSSSGSDDELAAALPAEDLAEKSMLEHLQSSGALTAASAAEEFEESLQGSDEAGGSSSSRSSSSAPAAGSIWLHVEDVVSDSAADKAAAAAAAEARMLQRLADSGTAATTAQVMRAKLERGQQTAERGRFRRFRDGYTLRTYSPVAHEDDLFLPTRHMGSKEVADKLANASLTTPVDPSKVLRQAVAIAEAARISAAANPAAALAAAGGSSSSSSGAVDGAEWTSMPLLDRGVLRQEQLRQQQERLAAKPKRQLPWQLMALDDYSFDLQQRPPTPSFDLLTAYMEVKYADVLLRKDAVKTLQRQMAVAALTAGGAATASEALETPPASLTAAKTLSPAEREGLTAALDDMLGSGQYKQYKEAVLQLYCDGLVSWGELQQCWAAAQAGEEMAAAEKAPVAFADDRQQLFALLSAAAGIDDFEQLQQLFAAPPSLEQALKQHWEQVSRQHLGGQLRQNAPTWQQLWQLLQALTAKQQQQQAAGGDAGADAAMDATALFEQYLRETEAVPLTPPPYPGARRLLRWEQRLVLGPTSGQTVTAEETKVKLSVSAAELQQETRLSDAGLQHMLAVAGKRYDPATGMLSLVCTRFPTREENRRWCLEVLHRLLQEGQARHPSRHFLLGPAGGAAAQQAAATVTLP
ncbi:hypothetical protein OEZ85_009908 [Tetradesmus obliquus]|uniref:Small ribosomal subunit protein mS35 mitochondrial conserved domain-containing protein n=1 Tax=Tetradesmus obliquus TaxID=3088 RepID=A0ABY8UAQ6_TETOB|nr:hypothetical protein OEZ85_009908 [Tetradesmus obliquus]